jgi:hypothetical protein
VQFTPEAYTTISKDIDSVITLNSNSRVRLVEASKPVPMPNTSSVIRFYYLPPETSLAAVKAHFESLKILMATVTRITRETHRDEALKHVGSGVIRV